MTRNQLISECRELEERARRCCLPAGSARPVNVIQSCWFIRDYLKRGSRGPDVRRAGGYLGEVRRQVEEMERERQGPASP